MTATFHRPPSLSPGVPFASPRRRWPVVAAALTLAVAAGVLWLVHGAEPTAKSLDDLRLVGARGPACLRLVIADDVSGSMAEFSDARDSAVQQIQRWSARNLRPDDQIDVLQFAENAGWQTGPTTPAASAVHDGNNTNLEPVLAAVTNLPPSPCDTALVLVSDAQVADLPANAATGRTMLTSANIHDLFLLVPGQSIDVPSTWTADFPAAAPKRFDGTDAQQTGLVIGQVVAALTRQQLKHI